MDQMIDVIMKGFFIKIAVDRIVNVLIVCHTLENQPGVGIIRLGRDFIFHLKKTARELCSPVKSRILRYSSSVIYKHIV